MEILTRIQHDLAYCSDKVMNLQILQMEVASRSGQIESSLDPDSDSVPEDDSVQKAFEFDLVSVYLHSEVKQLEKFVGFLKEDIVEVKNQFVGEEDSSAMTENLAQAESAMEDLQQLVFDLRAGSSKFEETLDLLGDPSRSSEVGSPDSGHLSLDGKFLSPRKQRKVLQMLEKSIARELDLEEKLTEAKSLEDDLKFKLRKVERDLQLLEKYVELLLTRAFEAETTSDLLFGTSKDLVGKLNSVEQVNLLKVRLLENQLRERENKIGDLSGKVSRMEKYVELNGKLDEQLENNRILERKVKDLENQLEHSSATLEAVKENETMLNCTVSDMDALIRDLKVKVTKAETRADKAEARCNGLAETNAELNEEVGFFRSKAEMLERSLEEMNSAKAATAKDIGGKAKVITDLVTKLALERERLHLQVATLSKKNKIMAQKLKKKSGAHNKDAFESSNAESLIGTPTPTQVQAAAAEMVSEVEAERSVADEKSDTNSRLESVRDIKPAFPSWMYILLAVLVVLISFAIYIMYQ
ncbi:WPP domain-interacting tail-anchored protein 1 [Rhynchospora pubera]|uniref:WPP domain-interacting tail-anchored protein 1 n=1 Tax=Rhynchospora pubera TaxID=906938 RepID=A0AAV8HDB4_9POAL|nr:WPP domain-interacting tail-anchored protein 1 [Rhynchospora pubera]